jgi:SSS family solute:Na+ symporter
MELNQLVLGAYFGLMLLIGAYFTRKNSDSESYFLADRKLGKGHVTATAFSTFFGAGFAFIAASLGYTYGVSMFLLVLVFLVGFAVFLYTSRHLKQKSSLNSSITLPQLMESEWDSRTRKLAGLITILIFSATLSSNFLIAGEILESVYSLQKILGIAVFGALVIGYTLMGGFKGVTWTDMLQIFVIFGGIFALLGLSLEKKASVMQGLPESHLSLSNIAPEVMVGYLLIGLFSFYGGQDIFQRIFASKDEEAVYSGLSRFGALLAVLTTVSIGLGVIARGLYPGIDPGQAMPALTNGLAGPGLSAVILAAYLSMANSSADSQLLTIVSNLREDFSILQNWGEMKANRILVLLIGGLALGISITIPSLVDLFGAVASWFAIMGFVVFTSIFWKESTEKAAFYSLLTGFTSAIIFTVVTSNFQAATAAGMLPAMVVMITLSKFHD